MATMQRLEPMQILTLGEKIKLPKTCKKCFYKHIRVVLCKKWLEKPTSTNESIFKLAKKGHDGKALAHAESSVWVKNKKKIP